MSNTKRPEKEKKPLKFKVMNIIGIVICVLLIPLVIINMTMAIEGIIQPDVPPNFLGYTPLIITTGSMSPAFDGNALVIVKTVDEPEQLQVGQIISYFLEDHLITHRIVEISSTETEPVVFITQGDFNNVADRLPVSPDQVFGTYVTHYDNVGRFALFMQTPLGMLLVVVLPIILLFACFYLIDRNRYKKALKEAEAKTQNQTA